MVPQPGGYNYGYNYYGYPHHFSNDISGQPPRVTPMVVYVPPNVRVGQQILVITPTGQQCAVVVPQGAMPGSPFLILLPFEQPQQPQMPHNGCEDVD